MTILFLVAGGKKLDDGVDQRDVRGWHVTRPDALPLLLARLPHLGSTRVLGDEVPQGHV